MRGSGSLVSGQGAGLIAGGLPALWWAFLLRGLFAAALGLFALIWPTFSLGISNVMSARRIPAGYPDRPPVLGIGVIATVVGAVLILWPGSGVVTISRIIGITALLVGGSQIYVALRSRRLGMTIGDER
jgi:uncharacterized membrane protein HdeD (DUF308 family)